MAEINIKKKTGRYEKPPTIALLKSLFPTISSPSIEHGQKSAGEGAIVSWLLLMRIWEKKLVGGFNPSEKYSSNWIISPNRAENKKYLKPPHRKTLDNYTPRN